VHPANKQIWNINGNVTKHHAIIDYHRVKKQQSGFTKDTQWKISAEKAWTQFWSFPFRRKIYV